MRPPKPATMPTISHSQTSSTASSTTANSNTTPPTSSSPTYVCIECTYPVKTLYTAYSSADDRQLGRGVRLTQCPRCKRFADKYVEHDFVVLFIDLVLIKPQVYRHLLFNRLGHHTDKFDPSIIRLGVLLLLFDVYLTWARIEKQSSLLPPPSAAFSLLTRQPIVLQYLFFLLLCLTETLLSHLVLRLITTRLMGYPRPNAVSTALLVSSCTKLFPLLMMIWEYDVPAAAKSVGWAVVVNNIEAMRILLDVGYVKASLLAGVGAMVRSLVGGGFLWWTGVESGWEEGIGGWITWLMSLGSLTTWEGWKNISMP